MEHGVEHALINEAVSHPLADDDVDLLNRELEVLYLPVDDLDDVSEAVLVYNELGLVCDAGEVNGEHLLGSGLSGEERQDAGPAADIKDGLTLEQMAVSQNCGPVGQSSLRISEHLLVDPDVGVGSEVVVKIFC